MRAFRAVSALTGSLLIAFMVVDGSAIGATDPSGCGAVFGTARVPNVGAADNVLNAIASVAADDVWAVGRHDPFPYSTLTEHWDGAQWTVVPSPNEGDGSNFLEDVSAISSDDAWAVGDYPDPGGFGLDSLILHWDGVQWAPVTAPKVGNNTNILHGVAAISSDDAWAVGESFRTEGLVLHWDGMSWTVVPTPTFFNTTTLFDVAAVSADDIWAVGASVHPFFIHWDGVAWNKVPGPAGVGAAPFAIHAIASNDIWAVGQQPGRNGYQDALIEHWDGTSWTVVPSPRVGTRDNILIDVVGRSPEDDWAVGSYFNSQTHFGQPLALHWDGVAWNFVPGPRIGENGSLFEGVSVDPDGHAWAAGFGPSQANSLVEVVCPAQVTDSGFAPPSIPATRAAGVVWQFDPGNSQQHTVTDASGMGLFDSGPRDAGSSFSFGFFSAGGYPVVDTLTSNQGRVSVPVHVTPRQGGLGGTFRVEWALAPLPAGFVADIQIKRPGSNSYEDWMSGQTVFAADFMPDAGTGTYLFRARLRSTVNGRASSYSPGTSVFVS
jgi:hypothetical protein